MTRFVKYGISDGDLRSIVGENISNSFELCEVVFSGLKTSFGLIDLFTILLVLDTTGILSPGKTDSNL